MSVAIDYTSGAFAATKAQSVGTITGSDVDLSSGQYFEYTPAADTTFTFSNAPASGTAAGFALAVTGAAVTSGYDLANASYDSVSFSVAGQHTNPRSVWFRPDGTKMFMVGNNPDSVFQYSLSSGWDVSSTLYDSVSFGVGSQESSPQTIILSSDGSHFYILGYGSTVYQYDMSSAFDLSTAVYSSKSLATGLTNATGLTFSNDGTKLYATSLSGVIQQFSMSTAWDVSSASSDSKSLDVSARGTNTTGIFLALDGTKVFTTNLTNDAIYEYNLATAYDISTGSYSSVSFSVAGQEANPWSFTFKTDGSKMYVIGNVADSVFQYTTGSSAPATITYPTSVDWPSGTAPDAPAVGETDVLVFYTEDGGTTYYGFQAGDAMA